MGRLALLLFLMLPSDQPRQVNYDSSYHEELYTFAEFGLKEAYTSSLIVHSINEQGQMATGSGNYFQVFGKTFILTAAHVITDSAEVFVVERSGDLHPVEVVHVDLFRDLAIVISKTKLEFTNPVRYRPSSTIEIGEEVFYCGHPSSMYFTTYHGRVSGFNNQFLLTDTFAWPGSSGSILFNKSGEVIGAISALSVDEPMGLPTLIPHLVRVGPTLNYTRRYVLEVLMDAEK
jgi:S1-C subfamily serine protease